MKQTSSRSCLLQVLLLLFIGLVGAVLVAAVWAGLSLPSMAEEIYGPAAPSLSFVQRISYSARLLLSQDKLLQPSQVESSPQLFRVEPGEAVNTIAFRLEQARLIPDAVSFRDLLIFKGWDTAIQSGDFSLSASMSAFEIARTIQDASSALVRFSIYPGWRAEEIAAALPLSGMQIDPQAFLDLVRNPSRLALPESLKDLDSLEGFLFPDTYSLPRKISAEDLIMILVRRFDQQVTADLREQYQRRGLTLQQAVTLASIVEREAVVKDEEAMIASVFYNRLAAGMRLESDPTTQYALGYSDAWGSWWKTGLTLGDLRIDSPYNTYVVSGLPPAPISNPGLSALQAVAYPAESPYYFFRAACDGSGRHNFSRTYEEHLNYACP